MMTNGREEKCDLKRIDPLIPSSSSKSSSRPVNTNKGDAETKIIEK